MPAWADSVLSLRTERAVVFKDGHALLVSLSTGKLDGTGTGFIENVPDSAVLGTFWAMRCRVAPSVYLGAQGEKRLPAVTLTEVVSVGIVAGLSPSPTVFS